MTLGQEYAWALGHGVALASLNNFANQVGAVNRRSADGPTFPVGIVSAPVDYFPVRDVPLSGFERGDGMMTTYWETTLGNLGWQYIRTNYFGSGTNVAANVTIYTRRHDLGTYQRYNAIAVMPGFTAETLAYLRNNTVRLRIAFNDLTEL